MKTTVSIIAFLLAAACCGGQEKGFFTNPVIRGDMPDPTAIRIGGTYYAAGTSSEWAPFFPLYKSEDLVNWEMTGHVFDRKPEWTSGSFWAPELFLHEGKVYCYYTARQKDTGISYIGVATAGSPEERFTDHGPVVEYGTEAIDPFVFKEDGDLYISWKAYGLEKRPIELLCCRLSDDGLRMEGEPFSLLKDDGNIGMEGQYQCKTGDYYYIIYAAHGCCGPGSDYDVYVARSKNFRGPYEKYGGNPILHGGVGDFKSCGHGTMVTSPDGRMFFMCHAYLAGEGFYTGRQPVLHELETTDDGWLRFKTGNVAVLEQETPFKGTVQKTVNVFEDDFRGKRLKKEWSWNFTYSDIYTGTGKGGLLLGGTPVSGNRYGTALCLRPQTIRYVCQSEVRDTGKGLKGLTLYGDCDNLLIWGTDGSRLTLKLVQDGTEKELFSAPVQGEVYLKMEVDAHTACAFLWSLDGKHWKKAEVNAVDVSGLLRWDRVQRPGLISLCTAEDPATFGSFRIEFK